METCSTNTYKDGKLKACEGWVLTDPDDVDGVQYGRQIGDLVFEFRNGDEFPTQIDLADYTYEEIETIIKAYGYTQGETADITNGGLTNIKEIYEDNSDWIIAECIFESDKF